MNENEKEFYHKKKLLEDLKDLISVAKELNTTVDDSLLKGYLLGANAYSERTLSRDELEEILVKAKNGEELE